MNFPITKDYSVEIKESKKINKYLDFAIELKKIWNMKKTVIPIVVGIFRTVSKSLGQLEITGRIKTIQITVHLGSARILQTLEEIYCYSEFSEKPPVKTGLKNSQRE